MDGFKSDRVAKGTAGQGLAAAATVFASALQLLRSVFVKRAAASPRGGAHEAGDGITEAVEAYLQGAGSPAKVRMFMRALAERHGEDEVARALKRTGYMPLLSYLPRWARHLAAASGAESTVPGRLLPADWRAKRAAASPETAETIDGQRECGMRLREAFRQIRAEARLDGNGKAVAHRVGRQASRAASLAEEVASLGPLPERRTEVAGFGPALAASRRHGDGHTRQTAAATPEASAAAGLGRVSKTSGDQTWNAYFR